MARALRIQYPGATYYITCKGDRNENVFTDKDDIKLFLEKLIRSLEIYNVSLLAYVCMPDHFHLLVCTHEGNLSEFMRHLKISYTSSFNHRHHRIGQLYHGRYKSFLIEPQKFLINVSCHIHTNPVRTSKCFHLSHKKKWEILRQYEYSSLPGYIFPEKRKDFINYEPILWSFGSDRHKRSIKYAYFVKRRLNGLRESPLVFGRGTGIVGRSEFVKLIKGLYEEQRRKEFKQPCSSLDSNLVIESFARITKISKEDLCKRGKKSLERAMLMEFLYRLCHLSQKEIGQLLGMVNYSSISQTRKRLREKIENETAVRERFNSLFGELSNAVKAVKESKSVGVQL